MTKKTNFSSTEWQMIKDGPEWVFAALAAADGNVALMIKARESKAFKTVIDDYRSRSELLAEVLEDSGKVSNDVKSATLSDAEQALEKISALLDQKATPTEASEYRRFLSSVAGSVASATGEGALGLGEKLSKKEQDAITKINAALKPTKQAAAKPASPKSAPEAKKPVAKKPVAKKPVAKKPVAKKPVAKKPVATKHAPSVAPAKPSTPASRPHGNVMSDGGAKKPARPKVIATHIVKKNETWTHLTLKYYGHTSEPYWRYLYNFNKKLIGDNYLDFYPGLKIEIPELPDHLKDKK